MKTMTLSLIAILFSINTQAQIKNVKSEVKKTVTTKTTAEGEKKSVKTEEVLETQKIELKNADSNTLNKEIKTTPVQVTTLTTVSANGVTNSVELDRSAYYDYNGERYNVKLSESGYNVYQPNDKRAAVLRKTSNNNYIYSSKNKTSFGYFNTDGNLVLESYNPVTDKVTIETFVVVQK
jgi:hypothetical protein